MIGLFGTCDGNRWRDKFMKSYNELGIKYFNPMVDDWTPEMAEEEAKHLANDEVIVFPILGWSYGEGSLAEVAFGPFKSMIKGDSRCFIFLIEEELDDRLTDADRRKASLRSRKLVLSHLRELKAPNIFLVKDLEEMLECSIRLEQMR